MEDLLVALVEILFEIFGEFLLQILFELVAEALSGLINPRRQSSPAFSAIVIAVGGKDRAVAGARGTSLRYRS